jgi:hypothetical protein
MKILLSIIFQVVFFTTAFGQEYEFIGILKFDTTSMISYRLVFTENNGKISGYSITDLQGENETKNRIEGTYNKKTKEFSFVEKEIDYTKSKVSQRDFCYVHFQGKLTLTDKSTLKGKFKGLFKNNAECVNGSLHLAASGKAYERMNKINKKIQKSKKVDVETKEKANLNKMLDSLKMNTLKSEDITSVFFNCADVELELWDAGKEDGDRISVFVDDKIVLNNYEIKNAKKIIKMHMNGNEAIIKIVAQNTGEIAPNTAKIKLRCPDKELDLMTILDKDNTTTLKIVRKNQQE